VRIPAPRIDGRGITYNRIAPSWSEAMNGRSGVFHPIRPHSRTYQGFDVSFHRELISTMRTGAMETMRPAHTSHRFDRVAAFISTVTILMDILLRNVATLTHRLYDIKSILATILASM